VYCESRPYKEPPATGHVPGEQSGTVRKVSVKHARLIMVMLIPAGKHLKRGLSARILIAGNVKFIVLLKTIQM